MIAPRYLLTLGLSTLFWFVLFFGTTWIIDPYGVYGTALIDKVNKFKPKRLNIDRLIKPYEVWRYQPHTIFMGTSRIHQSIDPAVLKGTQYDPAYNASVPANSLKMNVSQLQQYVLLDHHLKTVFVELFIYNFLTIGVTSQPKEQGPRTLLEYLTNLETLFISSDTIWDSFTTLVYNRFINVPCYEIKPGGFFYYPPGHIASGPFGGSPVGIWEYHPKGPGGLILSESAFDALQKIVDIAKKNHLKLIFLVTPNHAYVDYYFNSIGFWPLEEEWLDRLSKLETVYSFWQPNNWVYEPVQDHMTYWNDTFHFSLAMGQAIELSLAHKRVPGAPDNFMVRLTPEVVPTLIKDRKLAIQRWAIKNPNFVSHFKDAENAWLKTHTLNWHMQ